MVNFYEVVPSLIMDVAFKMANNLKALFIIITDMNKRSAAFDLIESRQRVFFLQSFAMNN
jgi:hypothetical protein